MRLFVILICGLLIQACVHKSAEQLRAQRELQITKNCQKDVEFKVYPSEDYCRFELQHPGTDACVRAAPDKDSAQHCIWAVEHPLEAGCEVEAKMHGGYWDCVRIRTEQVERRADRGQRAEIYNASVQQAQEDAENDRAAAMWRGIGQAFQPKPTVRCTTQNNFGTVVTTCN